MEFGPLAILAVLWWIISLVGGKQRQRTRSPRTGSPSGGQGWESLPPVGTGDSTQREGSRLERVLREFETALEESHTLPSPAPTSRPSQRREAEAGLSDSWEAHEEGESLDTWEPKVTSLEHEIKRSERTVKTMDEEYAALETKRLRYIEARNRPLLPSDHAAFDKVIRSEAPQPPRVEKSPSRKRSDLKKAVIWREILGPPNALK